MHNNSCEMCPICGVYHHVKYFVFGEFKNSIKFMCKKCYKKYKDKVK